MASAASTAAAAATTVAPAPSTAVAAGPASLPASPHSPWCGGKPSPPGSRLRVLSRSRPRSDRLLHSPPLALVQRAICRHWFPLADLLPRPARSRSLPMVAPRMCPTAPTRRRPTAPHPCLRTTHLRRPTVPYRRCRLPGWCHRMVRRPAALRGAFDAALRGRVCVALWGPDRTDLRCPCSRSLWRLPVVGIRRCHACLWGLLGDHCPISGDGPADGLLRTTAVSSR
jgi:hypothetical protein